MHLLSFVLPLCHLKIRFSILIVVAALAELSFARYILEDDYMQNFYGSFDFFTGPDPTNGFVKYVDQSTASSTGLIRTSSGTIALWGVDSTNVAPGGRPSIRLESKKSYNNGLIVLDVAHMPFGCGTWPAFWTFGPDWPNNGEIDIIEGVNEQATDMMSLHTGPSCTIGENATAFSGKLNTPNCDIHAYGQPTNTGCAIESRSANSYGAGLNAAGGGVYAVEWTLQFISIYFFPRGAIPSDVLSDSPNPSGWGKPAARFGDQCNIPAIFKNHRIVFDTTFCGEWAGSVWPSSSCASKAATCNDFVQNNPQAFVNAYWEIHALKVYQSHAQPSGSALVQRTTIPQSIMQPTESIDQPTAIQPTSIQDIEPSAQSTEPAIQSVEPTVQPTGSIVQSTEPVVSTTANFSNGSLPFKTTAALAPWSETATGSRAQPSLSTSQYDIPSTQGTSKQSTASTLTVSGVMPAIAVILGIAAGDVNGVPGFP